MTREGPPPGEATVVREADTEATRLRPPGPAPAHALRAQAPSPSPPVTRWIATGLGAAGLIAVGLFAGAYDPAGSSRVAPPSPARTLAAASPAETPHATAHETTVATPSLLRATARSTPGAVPVIATRTPSPTATVPADRGTLTIWMPSGWAAISVDGRALGINAPRVGIDLPAGAHRVTLENPPARFRQDYDVVITANRELRLEASLP